MAAAAAAEDIVSPSEVEEVKKPAKKAAASAAKPVPMPLPQSKYPKLKLSPIKPHAAGAAPASMPMSKFSVTSRVAAFEVGLREIADRLKQLIEATPRGLSGEELATVKRVMQQGLNTWATARRDLFKKHVF
jgi:hypothetical protein